MERFLKRIDKPTLDQNSNETPSTRKKARHSDQNNLDEIVSDVCSSEVDDESDSDEDVSAKKYTKRACLQNAIYAACHTSINSVDHLTLLQKKTFCDSAIAKDLQMGRTKCTKIIENVLCPYFKKELIADIGDIVFSLLIDESTDVSVKKQLGIVVRYYSESSRCIVNTFLKLVELEDSTASAITKAILLTLNEFNVNLNKFKGLGTDNANAMVGANKGVIAQLKNSNIILVPCVCHSVQLAVSSASKYK
ncbi:uncharacterized protein LOC119599717 [Lucilia sericata]|uniref:uncharacterized protein LOC119599717 n=1 Tax=Lucilia sericata TaxID=13632 RepID=UPI0018A7F1E2|nr:uncharacterized protein LOC119599717 [Lucilia sericata]